MPEPQLIDPAVFDGLKVVISTPTMHSSVSDIYADCRAAFERLLFQAQIQFKAERVQDTYLDRARNVLAHSFLETDAPWQVLFDADMGWNPPDVMRMLYFAVTNPDIELIGAPYPQKRVDWERVKRVVLANPEVTADQLACSCTSAWTFKGLPEGVYNMDRPVQLQQIGEQKPHVATGIMLIKRSVYEKMKAVSAEYLDDQLHVPMWQFFHCGTNAYRWVGEDTHFCRAWHDLGGRIWLAPWVRTQHVGTFVFPGDVAQIIDSGAELPA